MNTNKGLHILLLAMVLLVAILVYIYVQAVHTDDNAKVNTEPLPSLTGPVSFEKNPRTVEDVSFISPPDNVSLAFPGQTDAGSPQ